MSHPLVPRRGVLDVSTVAILLGLGIVGATWAQCPQPATPCPCCADGMCYPKRDTWGNYITHWRPWPGQTTGIAPTPEEQRLEGVREQLPPWVRPEPDQENLRGPARPVRPVEPTVETEINELPPAGGLQPPPGGQPGVDQLEAPPLDDAPADNLDLPGFGPQGALQPLPNVDDGPPALPRGLSQALLSQQPQAQGQAVTRSTPTTIAANSGAMTQPLTANSVAAGSRYVMPTSSATSIELTNPAAKNVQKTMDQDLHHAIYYEAAETGQ